MSSDLSDDLRFVTTKASPRTVPDTVARLCGLAAAKGLKVFAVIDQQDEAQQVGLQLRETTLVLLGSPAAGTPVMAATPLVALDLPLKIVVWSDEGQTRVSYLRPQALGDRYRLAPEHLKALAGIDALSDALVAD